MEERPASPHTPEVRLRIVAWPSSCGRTAESASVWLSGSRCLVDPTDLEAAPLGGQPNEAAGLNDGNFRELGTHVRPRRLTHGALRLVALQFLQPEQDLVAVGILRSG